MIRQATGTESATVVDILTEAFADDPLVGWLFPEPDSRAQLQARFYYFQLADPAAEAYLIGGNQGASLWKATDPATAGSAPAGDLEAVFGTAGGRLRALGQALASVRPAQEHVYLSCMGVAVDRRGAGLGSALLRHRLDRTNLAAYLEASSPRSRALYLRHGFEDFGAPVRVADSPLLWPMWRPATKENN
jgi:ribosomal protein S18 acetylase RimI-like enzyme